MQARMPFHHAAIVAPLFLGGMAAPALAGTPEALNHVPESTPLYVAIPNLSEFLGDLSALQQGMAGKLPPEAAQLGFGLMLAQTVLNQPGLDADGSAAILIDPEGGEPDEFGQPQPAVSAIVPIEDLETFAGGQFMSSQQSEFTDGILRTTMADGETVYMRDIGSHALMSDSMERLRGFEPGEWADKHASLLGDAGMRTMEDADVVFVANIPNLRNEIGQGMAMAEQQANMAAMMGGEQLMQGFTAFKHAADAIERDGSVGLMALNVSSDGVWLDFGVGFKEDTPSAQLFQAEGETGELMGAMPQTDFLFAYAFDSSNEKLREMIDSAMKMFPMAEGADFGIGALMQQATGFSGMIGTPPAMMGGAGMLSRQVTYARTDNPGEAIRSMRSALEELNGKSLLGMQYSTTYEAGTKEIAGVEVDAYSVRTQMDPDAAPATMSPMADPAMIQNMLYGMEGGPAGYLAPVDSGFYTTSSKNSELLARAINAGGEGPSLTAGEGLRRVGGNLHEGRFAEAYVSVDQAVNAAGPMLQMFGMLDQFEPVPAMPPLGMSARGDSGAVLARVYIPSDVIAFVADFAAELEQGADVPVEDEIQDEPDF